MWWRIVLMHFAHLSLHPISGIPVPQSRCSERCAFFMSGIQTKNHFSNRKQNLKDIIQNLHSRLNASGTTAVVCGIVVVQDQIQQGGNRYEKKSSNIYSGYVYS